MMTTNIIKSFRDLRVWQEGHQLVLLIYKITKTFPKEEKYGITDQMRRASTSVTANIAEGFGRQSFKEKVQFYYISKGSLSELENFTYITKDINYINEQDYIQILNQIILTQQILSGIIKKSKELSIR